MSDDIHPLFDPDVRDYWAEHGMNRSPDHVLPPPGRNAAFYHGTSRNLDNDTHITPPGSRGRAGTGSSDSHVWFAQTDDPRRSQRAYGKNVYRVEPTGTFTDNFDTPGDYGAYASDRPLRILSKVQWGGDANGPYQREEDTPGSLRNKGAG